LRLLSVVGRRLDGGADGGVEVAGPTSSTMPASSSQWRIGVLTRANTKTMSSAASDRIRSLRALAPVESRWARASALNTSQRTGVGEP
jgi:hypothetical protein